MTVGSLVGPLLTVAGLAERPANTGTCDADRELVGQGLASITSDFVGCFGISRFGISRCGGLMP